MKTTCKIVGVSMPEAMQRDIEKLLTAYNKSSMSGGEPLNRSAFYRLLLRSGAAHIAAALEMLEQSQKGGEL